MVALPLQDYEEAVILLLEGAFWEEALRLVRHFISQEQEILFGLQEAKILFFSIQEQGWNVGCIFE